MPHASSSNASATRRARNRARGKNRPYPRVRAKPVIPGTRCKLTRSCLERRMFFTPDQDADELVNLIGFCYGIALRMTGAKLHAAVFMSNHHHTDVTDVEGNRPRFKQWFHAILGRAINVLRGRFGTVWDGAGPCDTRQPTDEETLEDLVYTLTNPVKAGLVKHGDRWPGFTTYGWKFGETRRFRRPTWFFDADNDDLPDFVDVRLERPDVFLHLSDDELYELLMEKVQAREREIQADMRNNNRRFRGEKKVRRQRWWKNPTQPRDQFKVKPTVASRSKWPRIAQLQRDREWEADYAEARDGHRTGREYLFPYGTYWMRIHIGVRVAEAPP